MLKPQTLEAIFVLACSLVGYAASAPEQSHVRQALNYSVRLLTPNAPASRDIVIWSTGMRPFSLRPPHLPGSSK